MFREIKISKETGDMFLVIDLTGHGNGTIKKDVGFVWARAEVIF